MPDLGEIGHILCQLGPGDTAGRSVQANGFGHGGFLTGRLGRQIAGGAGIGDPAAQPDRTRLGPADRGMPGPRQIGLGLALRQLRPALLEPALVATVTATGLLLLVAGSLRTGVRRSGITRFGREFALLLLIFGRGTVGGRAAGRITARLPAPRLVIVRGIARPLVRARRNRGRSDPLGHTVRLLPLVARLFRSGQWESSDPFFAADMDLLVGGTATVDLLGLVGVTCDRKQGIALAEVHQS